MLLSWSCAAGAVDGGGLEQAFRHPAAGAKPWVLWHWVNAAASQEGINADLQAMRDAGLGGAYWMFIRGAGQSPLYSPPAVQLTSRWWDLVGHTAQEADRLDLELGVHTCDGFAVAGGPWITPELSMQQVVWSAVNVDGGRSIDRVLPRPLTREGYYRDIALLAFPALEGTGVSSATVPVTVTSNTGEPLDRLAKPGNDERFRSAEPCSLTFAFAEPFVCRSITIRPDGNNYQCQRLRVEASDDGKTYRFVAQLRAPRHGWQDGDRPVTHSISATTARYFRFVFDPEGSEPGSEDLDHAKWAPVLKVQEIELSSEARLHQFRGKNGSVWRVSPRTTDKHVPDADCVQLDDIQDISDRLGSDGRLQWQAPPGEWRILRVGHTSTGTKNETGGGGKGLECDKLSAAAIRLQFDHWIGEIRYRVGPEVASRVLRRVFVDSWECGSQNWSPGFSKKFEARHGYDPTLYLPAMAGYPVQSAEVSERFLYDVRCTIAELLDEAFFATLAELVHEEDCTITAECVAPTMLSDGMQHFRHVDVPTGEFWLRSPTHDKPNDIRDAISGAHVYGKPVAAAEAFTQLRTAWDEHPAMLKPLADRHFAQGINQLIYHVFVQNPWLDRKPGATLGNIGLYFQRDQVWWPACRPWVKYCHRVQSVLREGRPVVDIAVFTGEELPRRSVLPERLVEALPGLMGAERIEQERERLTNAGTPLRERPPGVRHSANMAEPAEWHDALGGYKYDSVNRDALLRLATVSNGRIEFPGGASYALLVIPGPRPMNPSADRMTPEVVAKLNELAAAGANILLVRPPSRSPSLVGFPACDREVQKGVAALVAQPTVRTGPWRDATLEAIGVAPDFSVSQSANTSVDVAWAHRSIGDADVYFVANQQAQSQQVHCQVRSPHEHVSAWDPVSGELHQIASERSGDGRSGVDLDLQPYQSMFIVLRPTPSEQAADPPIAASHVGVEGPWDVSFMSAVGNSPEPIELVELSDLAQHSDRRVRHFAGAAVYRTRFESNLPAEGSRVWLDLGEVANMAAVEVNHHDCGVAWTAPWRVDVTEALQPGTNELTITVYGTWRNRLLADGQLPEAERQTWTTATTPPEGAFSTAFGLLGRVKLVRSTSQHSQETQ